MKNKLFKNIFFIFFAFCFLSGGIFTLARPQQKALAENTEAAEIDNSSVPEYFGKQEYYSMTGSPDSGTEYDEGLVSNDTFMYFSQDGMSNSLKLSLKMGNAPSQTEDVYRYVYYPDPDNLSFFYFYTIQTITLKINGEDQRLTTGDFKISSDTTNTFFTNHRSSLDGFEMNFSKNQTSGNNISILDDDGNVKEGLYSLTITYVLHSCSDGRSDGNEENFTDVSTISPNLTYNFYVVDKNSYFSNNKPKLEQHQFDHEVSVSNQTTPIYANYYYSNYSSNNSSANEIPYIDFDFSRFDMTISKNIGEDNYLQTLSYDKDSKSVVSNGKELTHFEVLPNSTTCRVFFQDVGNYNLTLKASLVLDYRVDSSLTENRKYYLKGITGISKQTMVYVYGYQANYTDHDAVADENNTKPVAELKSYDYANQKYINGADITSGFLNSNSEYSQENYSSTFLASNVMNYVKTLTPIKTNQTPIKFTSNSSSTNLKSYVYADKKISDAYSAISINGKTYYRKEFTGSADSIEGKYVYVIAYTFKNYYSNETTRKADQPFYQVFYFEINKELPSVSTKTESGDSVLNGTFTNKNVILNTLSETSDISYNKDVTVQIYAYNYNTKQYMSEFGGVNGISFDNLIKLNAYQSADPTRTTLTVDAKYTIRLYYSNELALYSTNINSTNGYFRQQYFTIDKSSLSGIVGNNVEEIANSINFKVTTQMQVFSTNQSFALAWNEKNSGARTYAYYRYFPIVEAQYYSNHNDETTQKNMVSQTLEDMLQTFSKSYLPVNYVLNLDTADNIWLPYKGNTLDMGSRVSTEYVFRDAGLYLVDVYDEAGNHSVEMFMIDKTAPIFALREDGQYSLTSPSMYITSTSTLFWGDYKAIYIANFMKNSSSVQFKDTTPEEVDETMLSQDGNDIFKSYDNKVSIDIYTKLYNKLYKNDYVQYLYPRISLTDEDKIDKLISNSYTAYYVTIPTIQTAYYKTDNSFYTPITQNSFDIEVGDTENNYSFLIRDYSNTKYDIAETNPTASINYTKYYSARQTLRISFDDSKFSIIFKDGTNIEDLSDPSRSNTFYTTGNVVGENGEETSHRIKTTYLSPTNINKGLYLSFTPTKVEGEQTTQVDEVKIIYSPYENKSYTVGGQTYHYMTISNQSTEILTYKFGNPDSASTTTIEKPIKFNSENITAAGKYEIVRTYKTEAPYSYNPKDFYARKYILYVDRNEVITNAELVSDGEGTTPHLESLVGGDVFVGVFDNKKNADLVVTFPDSTNGNLSGSTLYNNSSETTARSVLTTNMLPVRVYVPQFKYTTYAEKVITYETDAEGNPLLDRPNGYYFKANYETYQTDADGNYVLDENGNRISNSDNINNYLEQNTLIPEYLIYAEIYKGSVEQANLIAKSNRDIVLNAENFEISPATTNEKGIAVAENGFLNFFTADGNKLEFLKDAGTYIVKIYQGGANGIPAEFQQSLSFAFEIKQSKPDFTAQSLTGSTLKSVDNTYYTNQSSVNLLWEAGSEFMADIDIEAIRFKTFDNGSTNEYAYAEENGAAYVFNTKNANDRKEIFDLAPTKLDSNNYLTQINLSKLGVYKNGAYVDITMQYKNHENSKVGDTYLYEKITKRIFVDLEAPSTNITNLVNKTIANNMLAPLTASALRSYYKATNDSTTNLKETSYNVSATLPPFEYFSYFVSKDFVQTLRQTDTNEVSTIYYRAFADGAKYSSETQETSYNDFNPINFTALSENSEFESGKYYEIVETDLAGNMAIYTIYVSDKDDESTDENLFEYYTYKASKENESEKGYYTKADFKEAASYTNATHNIYEKTGFELIDINYFGDAWAQIKLTARNANGFETVYYLMKTPWDSENLYSFVGNTYSKIAIKDLINGSISSAYKNQFEIYDRQTGQNTEFFINIRNTTLSSYLTNSKDEEYIRFTLPSDSSLQDKRRATTFLTKISIKADGTELCFDGEKQGVENKLGYGSIWTSKFTQNQSVFVTVSQNNITFAINPALGFAANTQILYEFTDNYGTTSKEIHLYKETIIPQEIQSESDLYSYYDTTNGRLYYITQNGFKYIYNKAKYDVEIHDFDDANNKILDVVSTDSEQTQVSYSPDPPRGITTITVNYKKAAPYNKTYVAFVQDLNGEWVKNVYFRLYDYLPTANLSNEGNLTDGEFRILDTNGTNITSKIIQPNADEGYFSEIRIFFKENAETTPNIPVKYSISTDKENWEEITSGKSLHCETTEMQKYYLKIWYQEDALANEFGSEKYVFGAAHNIYEFNLSALTSTYWIEKTVNGTTEIVEKSNQTYKVPAEDQTFGGKQYTSHYQVNISYANKNSIKIKTNKEQNILFEGADGFTSTQTPLAVFNDSTNVKSELYHLSNKSQNTGNAPDFDAYFVITYIPDSNNFVEEFYTFNLNGSINTNENLANVTTKSLVIPELYTTFRSTELQWTKYYGIVQNEISIEIFKDGVEMSPTVYTRTTGGKDYNYITLNHSGLYTIRFIDGAGNVQKFNRGEAGQTDTFTLIFLKDVPFTVTYTDIESGEKVTSLPIKESVYNGEVTLTIDKETRTKFYSLSGFPTISVKLNGEEYTNVFQDDTSYTFTESGYYEVSFTATSYLPEVGTIRSEIYQFTILNANEHKYSYIYNRYSNYYVEKVVKNGTDITAQLVRSLDIPTTTIGRTNYLTYLPLSSVDEKTGAGTYLITINSNDKSFKNGMRFTYQVIIKTGSAPIRISLAEGASTTKEIVIEFNQTNIYKELGECRLRIVPVNGDKIGAEYYSQDITAQTLGDSSTSITATGTFFIQIVSPSGNLLYSYKVTKKEPLNAAAIIAIVISAVVVIALIVIIIKLRKRISVK